MLFIAAYIYDTDYVYPDPMPEWLVGVELTLTVLFSVEYCVSFYLAVDQYVYLLNIKSHFL